MLSAENIRSSRRNLIRMGVVVASGVLAKPGPAAADRFRREDNDWDDRRDHGHQDHDDHHDRGRRKEHCFLKGTVIRTMQGDKKIEDLIVGDLLPTVFGGGAPIKSITRNRFRDGCQDCSVSPRPRCAERRSIRKPPTRIADRWHAGCRWRSPQRHHDHRAA
jgi:hypothetical protein